MIKRLLIHFCKIGLSLLVVAGSGNFLRAEAYDYWTPGRGGANRLSLSGAWEFHQKGDREWVTVKLPKLLSRRGIFYFRKTVSVPESFLQQPLLLVLEGVNFSARLRLNGQYLAAQPYGLVPLQVFVPREVLRPGRDNVLELEVDTRLSKHSIPLRHALFSPEPIRGIFRSAFLQPVPSLALAEAQVTTEKLTGGSWRLRAKLTLRLDETLRRALLQRGAAGLTLKLSHRLQEHSGRRAVLSTGQRDLVLPLKQSVEVADSLIVGGVAPWQPLQPNRYDVQWQLSLSGAQQAALSGRFGKLADTYRAVIGFREWSADRRGLMLNGHPFTVHGATLIEDSLRWLSDREKILRYLTQIQSLGLNTVSWFFPPPEQALALTDSLGLVNLIRLPVWNVPGSILADPDYQRHVQEILRTLAAQIRNHPSVGFLSLGNGYDIQHVQTVPFIRFLRESLPEQEGLLVTAGIRNQSPAAAELPLDFLTVDLTYRWLLHWDRWVTGWMVDHPDVPLLFADVYAPFVAERSDSEGVVSYEALQADQLQRAVRDILSRPSAGYVLASLFDFCSAYPSSMAVFAREHRVFPFGLAGLNERPRMAWNVIRALNTQAHSRFDLSAEEPRQNDNIFIFWGLTVLAVFLYYFRRDHRLRGNLVRVLVRPFGFRTELREGRKVPGFNTFLVLLGISSTWGLLLASVAFYLRRHPLFDFFLSEISPAEPVNRALIRMAWQPALGIVGFTLLAALLILLLAAYTRTLSLFSRTRLRYRGALTFVVWESSVFLFLLPLAFVFERMIGVAPLRIPLAVLFGLFLLWFLYRILKGASLVLAFRGWVAFGLILCVPVLALVVVLLIFDQQRSLLAQLEYLRHIWKVRL